MNWRLEGRFLTRNRVWVTDLDGDASARVVVDAAPIDGASPAGELTLYTALGAKVIANVYCDGAFNLDRAADLIRAELRAAS